MIQPEDDLTRGECNVAACPLCRHLIQDMLGDIQARALELQVKYSDDTPPLEVAASIHHARTLLRRATEE